MKLGRWSTTAGSNNTSPPDGWPEGQAPSTVNDCAREMMASIRTAFSDIQFFDQDITPTFVNATTFTVPGTQTSALHAGRRLKLFDAATQYAEILSSTATANTQVVISGTAITAALTSMAIGILEAGGGNTALPRRVTFDSMTVSAMTVATRLEVTGVASISSVVAGVGSFLTTLSVGGTAVGMNITKAFGMAFVSPGGVSVGNVFNVATVSKSGTGTLRFTFSNALSSSDYCHLASAWGGGTLVGPSDISRSGATIRISVRNVANTLVDDVFINFAIFRQPS